MTTITNKKANFNFSLGDRFEAGIVLTGLEVKSIKENRADISNAYVKIINGEAFLVNANMHLQIDETLRSRKLLLHRNQLISLETKIKQEKLTLIPTKLYTKHRFVKLEIALAKSKRTFEKKESIKRQDIQREAEREFKESI